MIKLFTALCLFTTIIYSQNNNDKKILPDKIIKELNTIAINDKKFRSIIVENRKNLSMKEIDSLWNLQDVQDLKNIKRVIEIIEEYGYLSSLNSNTNFAMHIILMHTPSELIDKVSSVIDKEYNAGRININSYALITWHLEGRQELKLEDFLKSNDTINKQ